MSDKLIPLRILFGTMAAGKMYTAGAEVDLPEDAAKTLLEVGQAEIRTDEEEPDVIQDDPEPPQPKQTKPQGARK